MKKLTVLIALAIAVAVAVGVLSGPAGFGPGTAAGASTFTVNTTGDASDTSAGDGTCETATAGECTLRAAIEEANALAGADTIAFNIPGGGPHTIQPTLPLPTITDPVIIDGYTQPGASANTNGPGLATNAVLMIELDGSLAGISGNGLKITAGSSTVKGLVINRFLGTGDPRGNGIRLETLGGNTIEGNYIGTDVDGTDPLRNGNSAVLIINASNNTIGGPTPAARNILSGNGRYGVRIRSQACCDASDNVVQGNYIGTDVTGTVALGNDSPGVIILSASNNTIGGTTPTARNIISGNGFAGVLLVGVTGTVVQGNYIGTDVTGTVALGNRSGVFIAGTSSGNTIGGTAAGARNIISGNSLNAVLLANAGVVGNIVQGNFIGTDVDGTVALGNGGSGVLITNAPNNTIGGPTPAARNIISGNSFAGVRISGIDATGDVVQGNYIGTDVTGTVALGNDNAGVNIFRASNIAIGGTAAGAGNIIAFNGTDGVFVHGDTSSANAILSNSIFSNGGLGIDLSADDDISALGGDGVTPNDAGDGDIGGNNLQNYPVVTSAVSGSTNLNSTANTEFRIEFFANTACDPSGNGEGQTFLGFENVTTDGTGNVSFSTTAAVGQFITATATDPDGNTSEFSECIDGDGLDDTFEDSFGGEKIKITNATSVPPNTATSTGDAASGSTITTGDLMVEFPPGTMATSPTTEIEIVYVADGPGPGVSPKVEISGVLLPDGSTKTIVMPFGDQNAVCIDDSPIADIETIDLGSCTSPRVEIAIPADGGTNSSGGFSVSRTGSTIRIEGLSHTAIATITVVPPPDEQININVVDKRSGGKLEGSCWRISWVSTDPIYQIPTKIPHDVVGDDVAGVKPDCGEPSNVKLFDKDPSAGNLRITITSDQRVQYGDIWHAQMSFSPISGGLDPNNYECDLSLGKCTIGPVAVGGFMVDLGEGPLAAAQPSGGSAGRLAGTIAGIAAVAVALTSAAWYARRLL